MLEDRYAELSNKNDMHRFDAGVFASFGMQRGRWNDVN